MATERWRETMKALLEHELKLDKEVFMVTDPNQLRAGDDWLTVVKDGLSSAGVVLLMLSRRSIKKPWVNFEAGAGWLAGKRVIPVCFGNQAKGNLPAPYSHWQGVNIPGDQHFLLKTVAALGPKGTEHLRQDFCRGEEGICH